MSYHGSCIIIEGSLEVKLLTIWTNEKAVVGRVREEEKKKENQRRERVRRKKMQVHESRRREEKRRRKKIREKKESEEKKMQVREKVEKSRNTAFFQCFAAPGGRKVGSLKWRVRSHLAR